VVQRASREIEAVAPRDAVHVSCARTTLDISLITARIHAAAQQQAHRPERKSNAYGAIRSLS